MDTLDSVYYQKDEKGLNKGQDPYKDYSARLRKNSEVIHENDYVDLTV